MIADAHVMAYREHLDQANALAAANQGLAGSMVARLLAAYPALRLVPTCDLMGEALLALVMASRKYDPRRGWKFSTYACIAIKRRIMDTLAQAAPVRLPANWYRQQSDHPTIYLTRALARPIDAASCDLQAPPDEQPAEAPSLPPRLRRAMRRLPERSQKAVTLYYLEGRYFDEVGRALGGMTKEGARKIVTRAIAQLREALA